MGGGRLAVKLLRESETVQGLPSWMMHNFERRQKGRKEGQGR